MLRKIKSSRFSLLTKSYTPALKPGGLTENPAASDVQKAVMVKIRFPQIHVARQLLPLLLDEYLITEVHVSVTSRPDYCKVLYVANHIEMSVSKEYT